MPRRLMPQTDIAFCLVPHILRRNYACVASHESLIPKAPNLAPDVRISRRIFLLCAAASAPDSSAALAEVVESTADFSKLPSGLVVQDLRIGRGAMPVDGNEVVLRWTGRLAGRFGWPFQRDDASESRFIIGRDKFIPGFEEGLRGMHEGGKRRLLIPAELGYVSGRENPRPVAFGDRRRLESTVANARRIAGAGTVVIDVELLKVRAPRGR